MPWINSVWPEDVQLVLNHWGKMVREGKPVHFEFRFKKSISETMKDQSAAAKQLPFTWILGSVYPDVTADGTFLSITGTLTVISEQKIAEAESDRRANDALNSKRQQENFVDMTSHEIRNPLNAILQCADEIIKTSQPTGGSGDDLSVFVRAIAESAETIV